jgi:tetratricopeptide (TPR) repeat protein
LANKRFGRSLLRAKRVPEAITMFERAIDIERAEVAKHPTRTSARSGLAFSLTDLGIGLAQAGQDQRSIEMFREGLKLRLLLANGDKNDWRAANLVATGRLLLGKALVKQGSRAAGIRELRLALTMRHELSERSPQNTGARAEIGEAATALADAYVAGGQTALARPLYTEALTIYQELQKRGSLTAELAGEPDRIAAAIRR